MSAFVAIFLLCILLTLIPPMVSPLILHLSTTMILQQIIFPSGSQRCNVQDLPWDAPCSVPNKMYQIAPSPLPPSIATIFSLCCQLCSKLWWLFLHYALVCHQYPTNESGSSATTNTEFHSSSRIMADLMFSSLIIGSGFFNPSIQNFSFSKNILIARGHCMKRSRYFSHGNCSSQGEIPGTGCFLRVSRKNSAVRWYSSKAQAYPKSDRLSNFSRLAEKIKRYCSELLKSSIKPSMPIN